MHRALLLASLLALPSTLLAGDDVTIEKLDGKLRVEIGGDLFTEYVYEGHHTPILYPVIGPHGLPMTRNFPMKKDVEGEAKDHHHHRSLWFNHGDVNGISFWHEKKGETGRIVHDETLEVEGGKEKGRLKVRNRWAGPKDDTVLTDTRTLTFFPVSGGRVIDYEVTLHASEGDVVFGDTKEGTMGIRTRPELRLRGGQGRARNSEGVEGKAVWGKRAKWVDYWAPIEGKKVGVAIFDHPSNPIHPTWWHARDYGLIAANPFGVHDFEKKPRHTGDLEIPEGKSVTFRYRFLFHEGNTEEAGIEEQYARYARAE